MILVFKRSPVAKHALSAKDSLKLLQLDHNEAQSLASSTHATSCAHASIASWWRKLVGITIYPVYQQIIR